jgi:Leucine-rich repeat (LRR) protein
MPDKTILDKDNIDITTVQKMMFIYNALDAGWTVKKLEGQKFEFIKNNNNVTRKEVNLENFVKDNLDISKLIN